MDEVESPASGLIGTASSGVKIGSSSVDISAETTRDVLSSVFNRENLGKILVWSGVIGIAFIGAKLARDYINRSSVDPEKKKVAAVNYVDGKAEQTKNNEATLMLVAEKSENQTSAMNYIGKNGNLTQRTDGNVNVMAVGISGDDLKSVNETFRELADDKIKVVIRVGGQEKPFEKKLPPTKTIADVCRLISKEYDVKKYFEIKRGKELSALDDDMTLAQAARQGSTVNWSAEEAQ